MKTAFDVDTPNPGNMQVIYVLRFNVGRRAPANAHVEGMRGRWDDSSLEKDADGHFFIDQPIELFQPMVEYLRAQACMMPQKLAR
mmetsp:Transcript_27375/g.49507  ORF Transcript_27375/g.49507 Transcript_27375/m.49507 type:complete len:85 (+) Transcript_27375:488-742(+)